MSETAPLYHGPRCPLPHGVLDLRGQRAALDSDVASLYGVTTRELGQAVTENLRRFPFDHVFVLTSAEVDQLAASGASLLPADARAFPRVFTARGFAAVAYLLQSPRAISASLEFTRAMLRFRHAFLSGTDVLSLAFELRAHGALNPELIPIFATLDALSSSAEASA